MEITAESFQMGFLKDEERYPAFVAAIGTGKTMFLLLKIWKFCQNYSGSLALIVRKEYTDLRDSTLKDFERYFGVSVDSNKEYKFPNGSIIMFRHGGELNVLKNINLSVFGIEQAEEFETEETFTFLRDRLRREGSPYRQGCIIANTNGHNWIWKAWKNNPADKRYTLYEASTFDNADNLPADFLEDLKSMEKEAPVHYKRFVMNSWEDLEDADILIPFYLLEKSVKKTFYPEGAKILSVDIARFGDDDTVFNILQKANAGWKQVYLFGFNGQDTVKTFGHIIDLRREYNVEFIVVDDDGVGGGVSDMLNAAKQERVYRFHAQETASTNEFYRKRDECYWTLKKLFDREQIQILENDKQMTQLSSIKFKYKLGGGEKKIWSKDEMRKEGLKSPDYADALMMAMYVLPQCHGMSGVFVPAGHVERKYSYRPMSYGRRLPR